MTSKLVFLLLFFMVGSPAMADIDTTTEAEKRYLIKIVEEIQHVDELAQHASENSDPNARVNLDYVALRSDLKEIKRALESHIQKPSRSPRRVTDLTFVKSNHNE